MIDEAVLAWFQAHRHPAATQLMLFLSLVHSNPGLLALAGALGAWIAATRERAWLWALAGAVPGAMLLNVGLKHLFARARPLVDDPLVVLHTYSFPSGHATGSSAFYAFLAWWLWSRMPQASGPARALVLTAAALLAALVGTARLYLGVHYLTDVAAGLVLGTLWATAWARAVRQPVANVIR